jgi:FG-GAP repeat
VAAADFNGDGVLDLAVANEDDNTVSVILSAP